MKIEEMKYGVVYKIEGDIDVELVNIEEPVAYKGVDMYEKVCYSRHKEDFELFDANHLIPLYAETSFVDEPPNVWFARKEDTGATRDVFSIGTRLPPIWEEAIPLYFNVEHWRDL